MLPQRVNHVFARLSPDRYHFLIHDIEAIVDSKLSPWFNGFNQSGKTGGPILGMGLYFIIGKSGLTFCE